MPQLLHTEAKPGIVSTLIRVVIILIALAVVTILVSLFLPELRNRREQAAKVDNLKMQVEQQKAILTLRNKQIELLKNDPSYLETIARDKLDLMKEGETILRLDSPGSNAMDPGKSHSR